MKIFYLRNCPHCLNAKRWIEELYQEDDKYRSIELEWIEESENVALADSYDYYYVPCLFDGDVKLHEGKASLDILKNIFDDYLRRRK